MNYNDSTFHSRGSEHTGPKPPDATTIVQDAYCQYRTQIWVSNLPGH